MKTLPALSAAPLGPARTWETSVLTSADLAARLNLRRLHNGSWRGTCPACGYPGTFSLRERQGTTLWACACCQDRGALTRAVLAAAGGTWQPPAPCNRPTPCGLSPARKTALAMAWWGEALPVEGTPAEAYLRARHVLAPWRAGALPPEGAPLRFHPRIRHPEVEGLFPVLLALVRRATDGEPVAVHRTYLRPDGSGKAALKPDKASFAPVGGGVVMLHAAPAAGPLVLAEGIETALSASALLDGAPAWSCVFAGNLATLALPAGARDLIIATDHDPPGQRAAATAARRWKAEGRDVRLALPDAADRDFNDLLRARHGRAPIPEIQPHG
ncbi:toprim domain-containing protein [Roseomonas sp. GC11]|uniref:DUF7146 domain-containing protein n=1 Tax=Roseomonas sp. GC11 TaxID=2950546 RepID=UPI00210EC831|nr:toprim domain-containing protein [Roseomonas sp. GC11]MCQ4161273.1 toprim domain-containing protein [Roseomonas sp. GC11]